MNFPKQKELIKMAGAMICGKEFCSKEPRNLELKSKWPNWTRGYKICDEKGYPFIKAKWSQGFSKPKLILEDCNSNKLLSLCHTKGTWVALGRDKQKMFTIRRLIKSKGLAMYFSDLSVTS